MAIVFNHKPGLVVYLTAGDPSLDATRAIALEAIDAGADVIELGVPFSDPLGDGPIIQRASERALARGTRLKDVLASGRGNSRGAASSGPDHLQYFNPILRYGLQKFADDAAAAGADGVLVTDLIVEEAAEYLAEMERVNLAPIFLAAPTSPDERLEAIATHSQGIYLRHFARRHYRQAAEPDRRCGRAGGAHSAMDQAAGGRGVRHLQRGTRRPGGGVRGCRGDRQRDCGVDREIDSRDSARRSGSIYQGPAPACRRRWPGKHTPVGSDQTQLHSSDATLAPAHACTLAELKARWQGRNTRME